MATVTWKIDADGNWGTAADWTGGLPDSASDVVIDTAHIHTITFDGTGYPPSGSATIHSLKVTGDEFVASAGALNILTSASFTGVAALEGATVTVGTGATFSDGYYQNGGTLQGTGTVAISGSNALTGGEAAVITGGRAEGALAFSISGATSLGNFTLGGSTTLTNKSTVTLTGGIALGDNTAAGATITNAAGAKLDIAGDYGIGQGAASARLTNAGTLAKTAGSGTTEIQVSLTDTGTISVASGVLQLDGPTDSLSGTISGAGEVFLAGGTDTIAAGTALTVAQLRIDNATSVTFGGSLTYAGSFSQAGPSVVSIGASTLTLTGAVSLSTDFGTPMITGSGVLATKGTTTVNQFILGGTLDWQNSGTVAEHSNATQIGDGSSAQATFTNLGGAHFNLTDDSGINRGGSANSTFVNQGTLAKTGGSGTSTVALDVTDTGTIAIASGTLDFDGPVNSFAGAISGAGQLLLGGGADKISGGTKITTASLTIDNGAAITLAENLTYAGTFDLNGPTAISVGSGLALTLTGPAVISGNFGTPTVTGAGLLVTKGATSVNQFIVGGTVDWENFGTVQQNTNQTTIGDSSANAATLTNESGASYEITDNSGIGHGGAATSSFVNQGTLAKTGGSGTSVISVDLVDTGTITIDTGTLSLQGPVDSIAGAIGGAGTMVFDTGSSVVVDAGTTIKTAGFQIRDGAVVRLDEGLAYSGAFALGEASFLNLGGRTFTLNGSTSFFEDFGIPTIDGSGTLITKGTTSVNQLIIGGTVEWENFGTVSEVLATTIGDSSANAATVTNESGANFNLTNDYGIGRGNAATSTFVNDGSFAKTGGTGTSAVATIFVNDGSVTVDSGRIDFQGIVNGSGSMTIDQFASLEFDSTVATGTSVTFASTGSTLVLTDAPQFQGAVHGLHGSDALDLTDIVVTSTHFGMSYSGTTTSGTLTVTDGTRSASIQLFGNYVTAGFHAGNDGGNGALITYTPPPAQHAVLAAGG